MSSSDSVVHEKVCTVIKSDNKVQFPEIIDDKINTEEFLQASRDVVHILGTYTYFLVTLTLNYSKTHVPTCIESKTILKNYYVSSIKF